MSFTVFVSCQLCEYDGSDRRFRPTSVVQPAGAIPSLSQQMGQTLPWSRIVLARYVRCAVKVVEKPVICMHGHDLFGLKIGLKSCPIVFSDTLVHSSGNVVLQCLFVHYQLLKTFLTSSLLRMPEH